MSADLFAEFGSSSYSTGVPKQQPNADSALAFSLFDDPKAAPAAAQEAPQSSVASQPSFAGRPNTQQYIDESDDWGDFEGGSSSSAAAPPLKHDPSAFPAPPPSNAPPSSWSASVQKDGDPLSFAPAQPSQTGWQKAPVVKAKKSADPSVLFDAEDDFGDDDFGDFEGTEFPPINAPSAAASSAEIVDLLGDLNMSQPVAPIGKERGAVGRKASTSASLQNPTSSFGPVIPSHRVKVTPTASVQQEQDTWDTFDDWEASIPAQRPTKAPNKPIQKTGKTVGAPTSLASPLPILSPKFDDALPGELPPTNVPPPAVLLTLFPPLFAEAQDKLFKPMAAQTLPMRNKVLAEPATITYLQGYMMLASVAGHIIAGRKVRWKRDKHLSQGMRIGPASSRATSGMKLSSIDKSENMKEEREASDVVRAWKEQVGRLRHVVSAANQIKAGSLGAVPDIQEVMPVKVLKQGEGGVPAAQPCMLCGLKRDERVGAVDQGVEDSFGEWWMEQVNMHRSCRNFWGEHKDRLRQR